MGAAASQLRFIDPPELPKPRGYTHVVEASGACRTIYVAGQVGLDAAGKLSGAPGDFRAQATQAFENLKAALEAADAGFEDVVKINTYFIDAAAHFAPYLEIRDRYVNVSRPPASTLVQVARLAFDTLLFEIEAVAVVPA